MKMKNICLKLISLALISFSLLACSHNYDSFVPYSNLVTPFDNYQEVIGNGYYKPSSYSPISYLNDKDETETISDFNDLYRDKNKTYNLSSLGEQKLLVIPVDFTDYACSLTSAGCEKSLVQIQNAFFGDSSTNQWESVASYYNKTSYGKFILSGKVSNWFTYNKSIAEVSKTSRIVLVNNIREKALEWYQSQYDDLSSFYIDGKEENGVALYLIYSHPYVKNSTTSTNVFWAYTVIKPYPTSWSSIELLNEKNGLVDSHTYIHEFGHILGLNDYYNTTSQSIYNPTGRLDMMDYTIGDHSGYSKMLLNWTRPYVINNETTLTISPFVSSGDLILLKNEWNKSPMDEYLLLEFYVPQGMNSHDDAYYANKPGIKVYHVDSRIGFSLEAIGIQNIGYINESKYSRNDYYMRIINDNSDNSFKGNTLYHLLESSGNNSFLSGGYVSDETLFYEGSTFGENTFVNYTFHDGTMVPYKFAIEKITNTYATIKFYK